MNTTLRAFFLHCCFVAAIAVSAAANAAIVPFSTTLSSDYLIVTTTGTSGGSNDARSGVTSTDISNFEIGANRAPVPSTDSFLNSNGGPTLLGAVPDIPASGVVPVFQGVGGNGNVAITNPNDEFSPSDIGVYADPNIGIQIASPSGSSNTSSNSFFNSGGRFPGPATPDQFPNTFTPSGPTGVLGNLGGTGVDVNPNDADQSTRIDPLGNGGFNAGITFGFDHSALLQELVAARTSINGLASTGTLNVSGGNGGQFDTSTTLSGPASISSTPTPATSTFSPSSDSRDFTISLASGVNVIDFMTGGNDISLDNSNLIIDGPADASVIFRTTGDNFLVSNGNILLGDSGIGRNNVLFYTDENTNDTVFGFDNTIINGAAFWSLGDDGGTISVQNGQGSSQFIADIVLLSDVRFTRWGFSPVPEPTAGLLAGLAIAFGVTRRGRRRE